MVATNGGDAVFVWDEQHGVAPDGRIIGAEGPVATLGGVSAAVIPPGGRRHPLTYDPKGLSITTLDRPAGEIILRAIR